MFRLQDIKYDLSQDTVNYTDSDPLAHGIKRRMSSSDERESDIMASDELGVVTVEVVAGNDDNAKKIKVEFYFRPILNNEPQKMKTDLCTIDLITLSRLNQIMILTTLRTRIIFIDESHPMTNIYRT